MNVKLPLFSRIKAATSLVFKGTNKGIDSLNNAIFGQQRILQPVGRNGRSQILHQNFEGKGQHFFQTGGTTFHHFSYQNEASIAEAYNKCGTVAGIIDQASEFYNNGEWQVLDNDSKPVDNDYSKRVMELLNNPNLYETGEDFCAKTFGLLELYGYVVLLPVKAKSDDLPVRLYILPNTLLTIEENQEVYFIPKTVNNNGVQKIERYKPYKRITFNWGSELIEIDQDKLIIIKSGKINLHSPFMPGNKIRAIQMPINNWIGAYESMNTIINYKGALGILSNSQENSGSFLPIDPEEKELLQNELRQYGLRQSAGQTSQYIITNAGLKWQQMGYPVRDLQLIEQVQEFERAICHGMGWPYELIPNTASSSLGTSGGGVNVALKRAYQNVIIPKSYIIDEAVNRYFDTKRFGVKLFRSFQHLEIFEKDKEREARIRRQNTEAARIQYDMDLITVDQALELMGLPPMVTSGNLRKSERPTNSVPLAVTIGVGGVQGLIEVIGNAELSPDAKQATLEILFNLTPDQARRMSSTIVQPLNN